MPDFVDLLIQPSVATASLEPSLGPEVIPFVPAQSLGASPPHDEVYELDDIDLQALEPGQPPVLGELEAPHYTEVLDQLWMEFDDPEERTAGRMLALVEQVAAESMRLHQLQLEFWDSLAAKTIPESEFDRFQSEYLAYLKRLKGYKQTLLVLPETSRDTDEIYLGLIKRRSGQAPCRTRSCTCTSPTRSGSSSSTPRT
ncbi:hypothetical protein G6O69_36870 [Pseudenhygromyxa sp. WMMC2535]|uniref:hypothetical protein n=1 Tax=Pseudenhygromyxa sp. WMMC2535 TaxID=2712867 RepID=UPI0015961EE9|nr:hypothetical protein [Pseudenhygromyxa sp. WMMC2535]NVB43454.1 hypothetical protein [Pseudenhygromyxa sp. WMMC2535]